MPDSPGARHHGAGPASDQGTGGLRYLPSYCDPCGRAILIRQPAVDSVRCALCGAFLRVIPGASYRADDVALFEVVEAIVYGAKLTASEAVLLAEDLERVAFRSELPEVTLDRLSERMPALATLDAAPAEPPTRIAPVIGMLLTTVSARRRGLQQNDPRPSFRRGTPPS